MKNKFIAILLIFILNLMSQSITIADEFNFNATEIKITENGNVVKGVGGGKVTTQNNQIILTANNFKYNKLTTLLEAEGNVRLIDKIADVIIESNEIFYLKNKEEIYTKGISKALYGFHTKISANDYFKYNKLTSLLEAKGNVKLNDKNKNINIYTNEIHYLINEEKIYTIGDTDINVEDEYYIEGNDIILFRNKMILSSDQKATITDNDSNFYELDKFLYSIDEEIIKGEVVKFTEKKKDNNLSNDFLFQKGFFNLKEDKFLGKDVDITFQKLLFNEIENDPRGNGASAYGDTYNTYIDKGVFTSCKKTGKCPSWQMRAKNIHHDKIKKQIIYKNAWLDILDFPVVYFPKFFHPDPSVKRQSGLIKPEIGDHDTLGDSIYLPYFVVLSDDKDFTIKPRIFNKGVRVFQNEYRQIGDNSLTIIDSSITTGHDSNEDDKGDTRSHFFANSKIDLKLENFLSSNLEINFEKSSNDTYLQLFDFLRSPLLIGKNTSTLESLITLDLGHEDYDLETTVAMYENTGGRNQDRYYYVLPSYSFQKTFDLENINGTFSFSSGGTNSLSQTNVKASTVNNTLSLETYNKFFSNGIKTSFNGIIKNTNSIGSNSAVYKNTPQSELISIYKYNISLPLAKNTENYVNKLTPRLSFIASPHDMKNNSETGRTINVDNVFSIDRLGLGNSFEAGQSLVLGIDFTKEKLNTQMVDGIKLIEIEKYFDFKLATSLKFAEEENVPINSTLNRKKSNVFGRVEFNPNKDILIKYDFSLTDNLARFEDNTLDLEFNFDNFTSSFQYRELSGLLGNSNSVGNTTKYNFNEFNSLSFSTRRNREINLTEYYDLVYEYKNDCLIADVKYRKDYYNSADIKPKEELFFSITIIPFYTYSPDKMILNKNRID